MRFVWKIGLTFLFLTIAFRFTKSLKSSDSTDSPSNVSETTQTPILIDTSNSAVAHKNLIALDEFAEKMNKLELSYSESWKPIRYNISAQNESNWVMDCSNTARFTYQEVYGIEIPRTSLDQYLYSKKKNRFSPIEWAQEESTTKQALISKLQAGDLLFWKNTYNVENDPPISHVMIYLSTDDTDKMFMFGAATQSRSRGSVKSGGIGIYPFDPYLKIGCRKDSNGKCLVSSEFVGWSRLRND
ncbi:MAG: C40 family peptidase [Leptospira sp.]|nr:C40 family peptidase [Leptospira sp.]NCS94646.1 C40 family peptidase [Leptospira sp.]